MYTTVTVKHILERKGFQVWSLNPDASVAEALRLMADKNIGSIVVIQDNKPVGIFSERDYTRKVFLQEKDETDTPLKVVMTRQVIGVKVHHEIGACLALMSGKFIRHLPVINDEQEIVGVISIGDVVKELVEDQKYVIDQLVYYINGEKMKPSIPEPTSMELP